MWSEYKVGGDMFVVPVDTLAVTGFAVSVIDATMTGLTVV